MVSFLFSFRGRISRGQYWLGNAGILVGSLALALVAALILAPLGARGAPNGALLAFMTLLMAAGGYSSLALQVKRFHDRGRSGWFALIPMIPATMVLNLLVGGAMTPAPAQAMAPDTLPWLGIGMLINLWLFVELGCLAGVDGPNAFDDNSPPPAARDNKSDGGGRAGAMLGGAQSALDRAIEGQARPAVAAPAPRPAVATAPMPAPGGSFGKRPAR